MMNHKIPALRPIHLKAKPCNHRALAWSSDAELAVATDDAVRIYLPTFPLLDPSQPLELSDDSDERGDNNDPDATGPQANVMGILPAGLPQNDEGDDLGDSGGGGGGGDNEDYDDDDDATEGSDGGGTVDLRQKAEGRDACARQLGEDTARTLWVSSPALHPELNLHVWEAAGKAMPLIRSHVVPPEGLAEDGGRDDEMVVKVEDAPQGEGEGEGEGGRRPTPAPPSAAAAAAAAKLWPHLGAGTGAIGGAGSTLNHVVAVEWSPAGLGRSLRPVLGVLTACGSLAVYGEGGPLPFGSNAKPMRSLGYLKGAVRDLQSWLVLWAVGENFVLPGQEDYGYGEYVKAFAWGRQMGVGQALLGYMNDLREIVVLCVGTAFQKTAEGLEEAIWNVQEVARMMTGGPHTMVDPVDPDYHPSESSFCLRWSPWVKSEDTWSCLLSYMDRNYVGFKRITINAPTWNPREAPVIHCESQDWDGVCMHLGSDAFLEFEDMIWNINGRLICRGIVATPLVAEPFEVNISNTPSSHKSPHSTDVCNTTFPSKPICNPITGLSTHPVPVATTVAPLKPLYTAVRLSATATNPQWWESSAPLPPPQWVTDITTQITRALPLGRAIHEGDPTAAPAEDGEDGLVHEKEPTDDDTAAAAAASAAADKSDGDDDDEDDGVGDDDNDDDSNAAFDPWASEGPEVYPHNMRLWGLALSPGGGSSAVLATPLLTQRPMRGAHTADRSLVLFGHQALAMEESGGGGGSSSSSSLVQVAGLSTEARLWEWMHGGGPAIPGLTPPLRLPLTTGPDDRGDDDDHNHHHQFLESSSSGAAATAHRARILALFAPFAAAQTCELCGDGDGDGDGRSKFAPVVTDHAPPQHSGRSSSSSSRRRQRKRHEHHAGRRVLNAACTGPGRHRAAVCGATGLAIAAPGVSRACGVCHARCLEADYLLGRVLLLRAGGKAEAAAAAASDMARDVCARCGGKFMD